MTKAKILVVDDDKKTTELVRLYLERSGYQVLVAHEGQQALALARQRSPDLIVLDLMLPGVDGLDICRILRAETGQAGTATPIIMLTARTTEDDRLLGLDLGADDYVIKPFSPRELVARVRAVLRRVQHTPAQEAAPPTIRRGPLLVDLRRHEVRLAGTEVPLTPSEFDLLLVLAREPGRVFSRQELLQRAFGFDYDGLERTVDVHVMNLRRKLEPDPANPRFLHTVYGVGYRFAEETDADERLP